MVLLDSSCIEIWFNSQLKPYGSILRKNLPKTWHKNLEATSPQSVNFNKLVENKKKVLEVIKDNILEYQIIIYSIWLNFEEYINFKLSHSSNI